MRIVERPGAAWLEYPAFMREAREFASGSQPKVAEILPLE
jgi:hypothetical protein